MWRIEHTKMKRRSNTRGQPNVRGQGFKLGTTAVALLTVVTIDACRDQKPAITAPRTPTGVSDVSMEGAGVSGATAVRLTGLWLHDFARGTLLARGEGDTLRGADLVACGEPQLAEAAYQPPTDGAIPSAIRRALGDRWLVTLCRRGEPVAIVAVARDVGDVHEAGGRLVIPAFGSGGEFVLIAIGEATGLHTLLMRDAVTALGSRLTGERVSEARLIQPGLPLAPVFARWRLTLDRPVTLITAGGSEVRTSEVYVGYTSRTDAAPRLLVAPARQPTTTPLNLVLSSNPGGAATMTRAALTRRAGVALMLEPASRAGGSH